MNKKVEVIGVNKKVEVIEVKKKLVVIEPDWELLMNEDGELKTRNRRKLGNAQTFLVSKLIGASSPTVLVTGLIGIHLPKIRSSIPDIGVILGT